MTSLDDLKRQQLEERLRLLQEQYTAAANQRNATLSAADRVALDRQIAAIEGEITGVERALAGEDGPVPPEKPARSERMRFDGLFKLGGCEIRVAAALATVLVLTLSSVSVYREVRLREMQAAAATATVESVLLAQAAATATAAAEVLAAAAATSEAAAQLTQTPTATAMLTPTPTATPTPMPTATSTPAVQPSCVCASSDDDETLRCLINAEAAAVNADDIAALLRLFAPDAVVRRGDTGQVWLSPRAYYGPALSTLDFSGARHTDIRQVELDPDTAVYTSGSSGAVQSADGTVTRYANPSPSDRWTFGKDADGCWVITAFEFNVGHLSYPENSSPQRPQRDLGATSPLSAFRIRAEKTHSACSTARPFTAPATA